MITMAMIVLSIAIGIVTIVVFCCHGRAGVATKGEKPLRGLERKFKATIPVANPVAVQDNGCSLDNGMCKYIVC